MGFRAGWLTAAAALTLAFASVSGCTFHTSYSGRWYTGKPDPIFVTEAPPSTRSEVRTACKGRKVWVYGYWDWQNAHWQWVSGGCRTPEPAGSEWVGPVLTEVDGGFELTPGHWAPRPSGSGGESVASRNDRRPSARGSRSRNTASRDDDDRVASSAGSGSGGGGSRARPRRPIRNGHRDGSSRAPRSSSSGGGGSSGGQVAGSTDQGKRPVRSADRSEADMREADRAASSDKRPSRPRRPIRGGMASAADPDRGRSDSDLRKPATGGLGKGDRLERGDRSDQEGMAEAEGDKVKGASFACKLPESRVKPGDKLEIRIHGTRLKGKALPVVKLGNKRLEVVSRTSSRLRATVPKSLRRAGRVTVTYRGERVACGRVSL